MTSEANVGSDYLEFEEVPMADRKTGVWHVVSRHHGNLLGRIKWYGAWRQYCFFPESETIWNVGCLVDVNKFIAERMVERRRAP